MNHTQLPISADPSRDTSAAYTIAEVAKLFDLSERRLR